MEKRIAHLDKESGFSVSIDPDTFGLLILTAICCYESTICVWDFKVAFNKSQKDRVTIFPSERVVGPDFGASVQVSSDSDNIYFTVSGPDGCSWAFDDDRIFLQSK